MSPLFSIAVPAYKATYLKECIDSILNQTYPGFEVVILNDASPYDLDSIVGAYSDARIRYIRNEVNCGAEKVVDNWNKCLEYTKGDYFICMGDDDMLMPHCLEEYAALIAKYPGLGVYHAWTEIIDEKSQFLNMTAARCEYESVYSFIWHRWNGRAHQYVCDFLYDTARLRKNGGFYFLPLAWGSDDITAIMAAEEGGIANTQRPCFRYRISPSTISNTGNTETKMDAILKEKEWYEAFLASEPADELDRKFRTCLIRQLPSVFEKKKGATIAADLRGRSVFRIFKWMAARKRFGLRFKTLVYAVAKSHE